MAVISREEVEHVALLARLAFDPEELSRFTSQLNDILAHVARLDELDTSLVEPTATVLADQATPLREDEPWASLSRDEALEAAPAAERGLFKVPRIVE